jgi:hypothetical protein
MSGDGKLHAETGAGSLRRRAQKNPGSKALTPSRMDDTSDDAQSAGKAKIAIIGVLCGGFTEDSLRQAGRVEIYPGPATLFARFANSLLAR